MLVDSHAHLNDKRLAPDLEKWLTLAWEAGVEHIINVGADLAGSQLAVKQAGSHPGLWAAVGIHPHDAKSWTPALAAELKQLAQASEVVAYGEIGLDYHYDFSPRPVQRQAFKEQLRLAKELALPVIIHSRDAHQDVLHILRAEGPFPAGGLMHCYSGSAEMTADFLEMGFYISFAGPVTFKNAKKPALAAQAVPGDRLLAETDCPYLSPEPYRGKLNHPARVAEVVGRLAELRGVDFETMADLTGGNARRLFKLETD